VNLYNSEATLVVASVAGLPGHNCCKNLNGAWTGRNLGRFSRLLAISMEFDVNPRGLQHAEKAVRHGRQAVAARVAGGLG